MKIAFVGGGALRLLGTVDALLEGSDEVSELHLVFEDLAVERADTLARLVPRMPSARGRPVTTEATTELDEALEGADFVYVVIRVGGVEALERDKRIAARHGYHGHDDYGPSGAMLTARTVPVVLRIAERMGHLCPRAWMLVFTNPIATLIDAVNRYSDIKAVGLCPGVYNFAWDMDHLFSIGVPAQGLEYRGGGLNHLSWVLPDATYRGKPVNEMIREQWEDLFKRPGAERCNWAMLHQLFELYGQMALNNGHQHHYWFHDQLARGMQEHYEKTPADALRSARQLRAAKEAAQLATQDTIEDFWQQPALKGCEASPQGDIGTQVMYALLSDQPRELAVTYPNRGHIVGLLDEAPVEAHALISRKGIEPLHLDAVPESVKGLYNAIAVHQRLTVDAAVRADKKMLQCALIAEPTIRSWERARPMFEELWAAAVQAGEIRPS